MNKKTNCGNGWFYFCRGFVQCLKLSPNLRKQTKEVRQALITKDDKKAHMYEVKKLETLLAMVREPDPKTDEVAGKSFIKQQDK